MHPTSNGRVRPIYMDCNATTPLDPRVLEAMLPCLCDVFGNAASTDHLYGAEAQQAVERARAQVAQLIGAQSDEILWTSGATEANNLAIIGLVEKLADRGRHIVTCVTEHHAVLDVCRHLEQRGWRITYLPVDCYGLVDPAAVRAAIGPETMLISIMWANNEIGTVAPVAEIGRIAREHNITFHTDATQAVGYLPVDVDAANVDLLSLSAHKMYGPKGVGALFVRKRGRRIRLAQQLHGGGHERGMRSGTLNVPGIVGLGKAAEIAAEEREAQSARLQALRHQLWTGLQAGIEDIALNGHPTQRLPHNLSVAIPGVESRSLLLQLKDVVACSTGSACTSARVEPSHVLLALGYSEERAYQSVRLCLSKQTTAEQIKAVTTEMCLYTSRLLRVTQL